jgi:hypothetical protein
MTRGGAAAGENTAVAGVAIVINDGSSYNNGSLLYQDRGPKKESEANLGFRRVYLVSPDDGGSRILRDILAPNKDAVTDQGPEFSSTR